MRFIRGKAVRAAPWAAGVLALALPVSLAAQSVSDFQLPPAQPTDTRQQGPVDESVPTIAPVRPSPAPVQTASPTPGPQPSATQAAAPPAAGTRTGSAQPAPRAAPQPVPSAPSGTLPPAGSAPAGAAAPVPDLVPDLVPGTAPAPIALPPAATATPATPQDQAALPTLWLVAAAVLTALALLAGFLIGRRRAGGPAVVAFERPTVPVPVAPPASAAPPTSSAPPADAGPAPVRAPDLGEVPPPAVAARDDRPLGVTLEATRLSASLVAATLSYRLTLTNRTTAPLNTLAIEGDMIAAHGSLPPEQQLLQAGQRLELRHAVMSLGPGESTELRGEIRLPLAAINPIRSGGQVLFIPLARFRVEAATTGARGIDLAETFVVGELPDEGSSALRPFRLDLGPRTYSRLGQRAVA